MRLLSIVVLIAGVAGCAGDSPTTEVVGPSGPPASNASPATGPSATDPSSTVGSSTGRRPEGFSLTAAEVTAADGTVCELCLWLADTAAERQRGLMEVTDLGGADGMAFVYESPSTGAFWMRNTVMPLSIAFFTADGAFVSDADMTPCRTDSPEDCELYSPDAAFTTAVEVPSGQLDELGIGAGSRIELLGPVDSCPLA